MKCTAEYGIFHVMQEIVGYMKRMCELTSMCLTKVDRGLEVKWSKAFIACTVAGKNKFHISPKIPNFENDVALHNPTLSTFQHGFRRGRPVQVSS